jgi:hypothetical protein
MNTPTAGAPRVLECRWSDEEQPVRADLGTEFWRAAQWEAISTQWNGEAVDPQWETFFAARWTGEFLYFGFHSQFQNLTMVDRPQIETRIHDLWDKEDVVEIFMAPDLRRLNCYKEFELSPSAQWIEIDLDRDRNFKNFNWDGGMESRSAVNLVRRHWQAEFRVSLESLGMKGMAAGTRVALNAFRVELKSQLYLAWNPTMTPKPDFHVPQRFGRMLLSR